MRTLKEMMIPFLLLPPPITLSWQRNDDDYSGKQVKGVLGSLRSIS